MGKKKDKKMSKKDKINFDMALGGGPAIGKSGKKAKDLLDRYGVEGTRHYRSDSQQENRTPEMVKKDLQEAMMNDYDTRQTLNAAAMAGDKDAKKWAKNGIDAKAKDFLGAWQTMKGLKKKHVGGGGMRGAKNEAGLTYALTKHDREKQTEGYRDEFASKDALAELEDKLNKGKQEEDEKFVPDKSEQTLKDEATVEYWDENFATGGIYGEPGDDSDKGPRMSEIYKEYGSPLLQPMINKRKADEKSAATTFLDAYKRDLFQGGSALMPEI